MEEFKVLKKIKEDKNKAVDIIEFNGQKVLLKRTSSNDTMTINMLKNEANILYKLRNTDFVPNILSYNFEENNNYVMMELVYGKRISTLKNLTIREKILVMIEVLKVVDKLHSYGIIHCDLKPENILIGKDKKIKLIDFGISICDEKKYFTNYASVAYCSVQQIMQKEIDFKTDLYSLGVVFYVLLFDKFPFDGSMSQVQENKIKCNFNRCNNELLNYMFLKLFDVNNEASYKNINDFKVDLSLLLKLINK